MYLLQLLQPSVPQLSVPSTNIPKGMWDSVWFASNQPTSTLSLFHFSIIFSLPFPVNNKKNK